MPLGKDENTVDKIIDEIKDKDAGATPEQVEKAGEIAQERFFATSLIQHSDKRRYYHRRIRVLPYSYTIPYEYDALTSSLLYGKRTRH